MFFIIHLTYPYSQLNKYSPCFTSYLSQWNRISYNRIILESVNIQLGFVRITVEYGVVITDIKGIMSFMTCSVILILFTLISCNELKKTVIKIITKTHKAKSITLNRLRGIKRASYKKSRRIYYLKNVVIN